MFDGLILDIDGTIWDTTGVVERAWNCALEESGLSVRVSADQLKGLFGLPMLDIIDHILPSELRDSYTKEQKVALLEALDRKEIAFLQSEGAPVYEGLVETLATLADRVIIGIVSNCQAGYAELMLEKTGINRFSRLNLCPDDTGYLKAGNICVLADRLGMKHPVYVGDTAMDEKACVAAGVPFVFASYGFGTATAPLAVLEKPSDLLKLFDDGQKKEGKL